MSLRTSTCRGPHSGSFEHLDLGGTGVAPVESSTSRIRRLDPYADAGQDSRRDVDGGDDRRLDSFRKRLILEVQLQCHTQVGKRLIETLPLAGHFHLEAAGHVPGMFVVDGCVKRKSGDRSASTAS